MLISTRGRYALRVMIDLAEHTRDGYIPMKEIAERQKISLKYLERIVPVLVQNGLLAGIQGKSGGYRLTRTPEEYSVGEILRLTDGNLAPVSCLECDAEICDRMADCKTLPMWKAFHQLANDYFDGISIATLLKQC
ncbi:MAG: Rrf2 family transcriptional regulator [Clostridia bacterium]|nr:Rrf2 family transcriptional regulator [Clostridia bacterium]